MSDLRSEYEYLEGYAVRGAAHRPEHTRAVRAARAALDALFERLVADAERLDALQARVTRDGRGNGLVEIWSNLECRIGIGTTSLAYSTLREAIDAARTQGGEP